MMDFNRTITINNYHAIINMVKRTDAFILGNQWQRVELEKGNICSISSSETAESDRSSYG